ncbi:MAG TPA: 2-dehydro-3-deoxy-D-gluconate 5-dehydrogenase KduD [Bryobacteraceae bacterium]|nr:2-dehydro-3-deoxy-D-gluconate 5-dehydrogenase KduD [Bryobacteraceae bacterium]
MPGIPDCFSLKGKNALVTGSRTGLGAAMAVGLARAGANVAVNSSTTDGIDEVCRAVTDCGAKAVRAVADVADARACEEVIELTVRELGSIDILINNAGIIRRSPAAEYSAEDWARVLEIDLNAVFRLCQLAGRRMLAQGSGKIVNIASLLSFQGGILVPAYAAAKGAVAQLTKALANEWASKGINVNAIAPGYMETNNTRALRADPVRNRQILERIPAGRWGKPEDLAAAAVFLASAASDYMHGHVLVVDGGWMAR